MDRYLSTGVIPILGVGQPPISDRANRYVLFPNNYAELVSIVAKDEQVILFMYNYYRDLS